MSAPSIRNWTQKPGEEQRHSRQTSGQGRHIIHLCSYQQVATEMRKPKIELK